MTSHVDQKAIASLFAFEMPSFDGNTLMAVAKAHENLGGGPLALWSILEAFRRRGHDPALLFEAMQKKGPNGLVIEAMRSVADQAAAIFRGALSKSGRPKKPWRDGLNKTVYEEVEEQLATLREVRPSSNPSVSQACRNIARDMRRYSEYEELLFSQSCIDKAEALRRRYDEGKKLINKTGQKGL